jgi:aspartyl-tRNA(Asn)/glutamyl-tRNA(Gln) amidotransferase subunit B
VSARGGYEVVIGLETHVHMKTRTKLFCACELSYGDPPNHHTCPTCLALPGALPVLNEQAVDFALRAALATHGTVHPRSIFARKNYFYPDLPKGYQISQYEEPYSTGGFVEIDAGEGTKRVRLTRIHMEEDAGKSVHAEGGGGSLVDLNRSGTPLLEIVTEPDLRSAAEAEAYLRALQSILRYLDVSDVDLEHGHFRCDVNVSLRPRGASAYGTRAELKNLNSFRFIMEAIAAETERQTRVLDAGGTVQQCTLRYHPKTRTTSVMRVKENADDYRYFPDPDLIPLVLDAARIERARGELPELPEAKRVRFAAEYGLGEKDVAQLTETRALADFFEAAARAHGDGAAVSGPVVSKWLLRDVARLLKERGVELGDPTAKLEPGALARLIGLVEAGATTSATATASLLPALMDEGGDPAALMAARGLEAVSDTSVLEAAVAAVLAEHADVVARIRAGETKLVNALMGPVMKRTQGKADPAAVREILARTLADREG